jgi:hypothetical protein
MTKDTIGQGRREERISGERVGEEFVVAEGKSRIKVKRASRTSRRTTSFLIPVSKTNS